MSRTWHVACLVLCLCALPAAAAEAQIPMKKPSASPTPPAVSAEKRPAIPAPDSVAPATAVQAAVTSASPAKPALTVGGRDVVVTLEGSNLGMLTGGQALLNGAARPEVAVTLGRIAMTLGPPGAGRATLPMTLKAASNAPPGNYLIRLTAGSKVLDLASSVVSVAVAAPAMKISPAGPSAVARGGTSVAAVQTPGTTAPAQPAAAAGVAKQSQAAKPAAGAPWLQKKPQGQATTPGTMTGQKQSQSMAKVPVEGNKVQQKAAWRTDSKRAETSTAAPSSVAGASAGTGVAGSGIHYAPPKSAAEATGKTSEATAKANASGTSGVTGVSDTESEVAALARKTGLSEKEVLTFMADMQRVGADDQLDGGKVWDDVATKGKDKALADAMRGSWGIPNGVADGASPRDLAEAGAIIQVLGGEVSDSSWWTDFDATARGQMGIPGDAMPGKDLTSLLNGLASIQLVGADPGDLNVWSDVGAMQEGRMSGREFVNKWTSSGPGGLGVGGSSGSSSGSVPGTTDTKDSAADRTTVPGGVAANNRDLGPGGGGTGGTSSANDDQPGTETSTTPEAPSTGTGKENNASALISNSVTGSDGSYSYEWDIYAADGTFLGSGTTVCGGGTCTDYYDGGGSYTYADNRGAAPDNGVQGITAGDGGSDSGSGSSTDTSDSDSSTDSEDSDTSDDSSAGTGTGSEEDEEEDEDESGGSEDEDGGSTADGGESDEGDSGSGTSGTPLDPSTMDRGGSHLSMEAVRAHEILKLSRVVTPSGEAAAVSSATVSRKPPGTVDPAPGLEGGVVAGSQATAADRSHSGTVDPSFEAASATLPSGPGQGPSSTGPDPGDWECRRRMLGAGTSGCMCLCPVERHPVTNAPIPMFIPCPRPPDLESSSGSDQEGPAGIEVNNYNPWEDSCLEYTDTEYHNMYPDSY